MGESTVVRTVAGGTVRRIRSVADTSVTSDGHVATTHVRKVSDAENTQGRAFAQKIAVYGFAPSASGHGGEPPITLVGLNDMIVTEIANRHAGDLDLDGDIAANRIALQAAIDEARSATDQAHNELLAAFNLDQTQTNAAIQEARDAAVQAHNELLAALDLDQTQTNAAIQDARNAAAQAHDELQSALTLETATRETAVSDARAAASAAHDALQGALNFEAATRESADAVIASSVTTISTRVDSAESNITTEIASRTTADSALGLRIDSVTATLGDVSAAVTTEIAARATADEALSGRIDTVKADLDTASANITSEQTARVTADTALGTRIDTVKASVDSNTAAISTETTARVTADEAIGIRIDTLTTTVDGNTAAITSESVTRSDHDSALSDRIDTVNAAVGTNAANLSSEITARASADEALGARIDTLKTTVDGNTAAITAESVTRSTKDDALAGRIDTLTTTVDGNTAAISSEAITRSDHDSALSTRIDTLTATVGSNSAAISSEQTTRATADEALGVRIDTLKTTVDSNTAAITSESVTRSDHDSALSDRIDTVSANVGTNSAALSSEVTARTTADSALGARIDTLKTTVDGNTAAITSEALTRSTQDDALAGRIDILKTTVDSNTAAISSEAITRSDHDSALSTRIDTLTATVGSNSAAISSEQTTRATADEALGVRIDTLKTTVDGNTAAISSEQVTRSTADSALSDRIDTVNASVGTTSANLTSETTARVTADSALGARIDTITASLGDTNAAVTSESVARATADEALSGRIDTVQASLGTTNANVTSESIARATADSALGARIDTVTANLGTANAAITSESIARTTADDAIGARIDTLKTSVDANSAAISNEVTARTTADSALAGRIDTTNANVASNAAAIANEVAARAAADLAETTERQSQSSSLAASGVKGAWVQGSAPDWENVYPIGVNRIRNSDFANGEVAWGGWDNTGLTVGHGVDLGGYTLSGGHTLYRYVDGTPPLNTVFDTDSWNVPVRAGNSYEASAYISSHRCIVYLIVVFYDSNGNWIQSIDSTQSGAGNDLNNGSLNNITGGNGDLSTYKRLWVHGAAPATATQALLVVRAVSDGVSSWPYQFITRPKFSLMAPGQSKVSDWTPTPSPVWFNTSDYNRPYTPVQNYSIGWALTDDQRIAANAANITAVNAALTSESATRATADAAETAQREAAVSSLQHGLDLANAAVTSEATTRATADAAETSAREAAVSTLTTGLSSANAAIASEASTRAAADDAEAIARKTMSSSLSTPGGCFSDPLFLTNPLGSNRTPNGWQDETYFAPVCTITTTGARYGDRVLKIDVPANTQSWGYKRSNAGGWQGVSGSSATGQRYFVIEADFEFLSGDLHGAAVLVANTYAAGGWIVAGSFALSAIAGSAAPATSVVYSLRKVVDCGAPENGGSTIAYIMPAWTGSPDYAGSLPAKSFLLHRYQLRPATQAEIDTLTAGGAIATAINAAIATEATTRATADSAEAALRTALKATVDANTAAIANEAIVRATGDSTEAIARQTVSSRSQRKVWRQATAPGGGQMMFPVGSNRLLSSDFTDATPWSYYADNGGVDFGSPYILPTGHTFYAHRAGATSDPLYIYQSISIIGAGQSYEWSAWFGCHRCYGVLHIDWFDASSNWLSGSTSSDSVAANTYLADGGLSTYKRLSVIATAPTGAASAVAYVIGYRTGEGDPYVFVTQPFWGRAAVGQTAPSDYSPSATDQVWVNTADNNKTYIWNGSSWVYSADARIDSNSAAITVAQSSIGGLQAKYGVTGSINGVTGGFVLSGIGKNDGSASWLLEITSNVIIHGNLVIDGTITTGKMGANAVSHALNTTSTSNSASGSLTVRAGSTVQIIAYYAGGDATDYGASLNITINGATFASGDSGTWAQAYTGGGGKSVYTSYAYYNLPALVSGAHVPTSDGTITIAASVSNSGGGGVSGKLTLVAIELAR